MIVLAGIVLGALYGAWLARSRRGNRWDMAQYAVGFAIAFGLAALFVQIFLMRGTM